MNDHSQRRRAILAHVPEGAVDHVLGDYIQILDVVHHNRSILAAQFQHDTLEVGFSGILEEKPTGVGGTGEADRGDIWMTSDGFAGLLVTAGHHVEHTGCYSGLVG